MGSCCTADAPTPPNPQAVAAAQTGTNVSTGVANSFLNNVNQISSQGELRYDPTGTYNFTDPATGTAYTLPRWTQTQILSPDQQNIFDLGEQSQTNLANLAVSQSGKLNTLLGSPIDTSGAPGRANTSLLRSFPYAATEFGDAGSQQRNLNQDFSADRKRVEDAMYQRMDPQLQRDRAQMEARLADQGIKIGSPAYQAAMDQFGRQLTDTRLGITEKGLAEQQAGFNQALQSGQFYNSAQGQDFQQAALRGQFGNQGLQQRLGQEQAAAAAENDARSTWLTEQYALRNQPLNEIASLMSGSQVSQPNFPKTNASTIANTDYAGISNSAFNQNFANYQQSSQNFNQLMGGIFGAMSGLVRSDERVKNVGSKLGTVFAAGPDGEKPLPVYEYSYKDDPASMRHVGPMAQDVQKIDPKAVKTRAGTKYIDMTRMGSILRNKVA